MRKLYSTLALGLAVVAGTGVAQAAPQRIPIQEEKPLEIYALGAANTTGIYKINPTDLANPTILARSGVIQYTGTPLGGGGTFLDPETVVGIKYSYAAYPFEATAAGTEDGPWVHSYYAVNYNIPGKVYDMTLDETTGDIYCWYDVNDFFKTLGKYDRATHSITRVGNSSSYSIFAIAADADGQLWGVGTYGTIYKIDKTTGAAEDVTGGYGSNAQIQSNIPASAAIDPATGDMYLVGKAGSYDTFASLMKINLETLSVEKLGSFESGYYNCLYIAGSSIAEGAPAPALDLAAAFNGSKTVVTFTAPAETNSGATLSGELDYTVSVDGVEAYTGKVNAGTEASCELELADGTHEISVALSNAAGTGKAAKTSVYSGYDVPTNISGLTATADGADVALTWNAPTGKNGGLLDLTKLRYAVARGDQEIASGLEETAAADQVSGPAKQHTYTVTVVYGDEALESSSVSVLAGEAYDIPYALDLQGIESLGEIGVTVIDADGNSNGTWTVAAIDGEPCVTSYTATYFTRNDYLFLPPANYKAGATYTISFKAASNGTIATYLLANKMRVVMAATPTTDAAELTDLYTDPDNADSHLIVIDAKYGEYDWTDFSVEFTVEEDGVYSVGLVDQAAGYDTNSRLAVKDVVISVEFAAPLNVTNLTAVPQAENNRNIDISFTLPSKDVDGGTLASLSKVEIYRGTTLLTTLTDDITPGAPVAYTDEMAPRGIVSYSVVAYNGTAASGREYFSVHSGYTNNIMVKSVTYPLEAIPIEGEGTVTAIVANDGIEQVLEGDYEVVLLCNGEPVEARSGEGLAKDGEATYEFIIAWTTQSPASALYAVQVNFSGDQNEDDDTSDEFEIRFDRKDSGVADASTSAVSVRAAAGTITVEGAEGLAVSVYATDGTLVDAAASAPATFSTRALPAGIYVVRAGNATFKVAL